MYILALNTGSSSLKYGLYEVEGDAVEALFSDQTDAPGGDADPLQAIIATLRDKKLPMPGAIGHRIVHGGPNIRDHARIDAALMAHLEEAKAFAPLHVPPAVEIVKRAREAFPGAPQVACFDTAFHKTLPTVAKTLPLPADLRAGGIERYGFHGLSYESIVRQLGTGIPARVVIAHLGNGASLCAVRNGRSIDTTMGLTPTGGIVMGTRPGDLDPGVLLYLMREKGYDAERLERLVDRESGLKGLSGGTSDMRKLHAANDDASRLALDVFVHTARKHIAAMVASLGGLDLLVFTGGIGENDAVTRDAILAGLQWLGNFDSRIIPTEEDAQIARHTATLANL
jgi:acetate kinase